MISSYHELHARGAFSFLRGASNPEDLAQAAAERNLPGMALCDRDGVYGAPRFFMAAREKGIRAMVGAELTMEDGTVLPLLAQSRAGYRNLCRLITESKLRAPKNESRVRWDELPIFAEGLVALTGDEEGPLETCWRRGDAAGAQACLDRLTNAFGRDNVFVELQRHHVREQHRWTRAAIDLARARNLPLLATNGVLYARPEGRAVADVFACLRHHTHLDAAGSLLARNGERFVKSAEEMTRLFADIPEAIANTQRLAERLDFTLEKLGYEFPSFDVPTGETMESFLWKMTFAGAGNRFPGGIPDDVKRQLERELTLIAKLGFSGYFLIIWDLVQYAMTHDIMVQGRGSAANSAVCYCLEITQVDPVKEKLLFERFLSESRKSWPDIDLDLPSGDKREQVIQEVYRRYGRHGAAMTANVITYRGRSAIREVGKVLHFPEELINRYSSLYANGDFPETIQLAQQLEMAGIPKTHPRGPALGALYRAIYGLPRHLGQHSGGMIICQGKLDSVVPLENASMPGRVVAQWDKDDCEDMGIVKVDLLGLGMMSVLQDAFALAEKRGRPLDIAHLDRADPATFEMMQKADTIGVFQIESRAQIATLPRMKPATFYDVVIEVAIIRPGPIQ